MVEVHLPQLGESVTEGVVTRWLVAVGDVVSTDQAIVEVSTDKVDTEIPSPVAGTVTELRASVDDTVEVGAVLAVISEDATAGPAAPPSATAPSATAPSVAAPSVAAPSVAAPSAVTSDGTERDADVVVLGGGTGGYSTALRAAQLGLKVVLVERAKVGGTCLHWGCIPTKAILQSAEVADAARDAAEFGIRVELHGID
ncbi:MAG: dihydrolipoyl dehydrogenase, partial [Actinomycetota bacterium]